MTKEEIELLADLLADRVADKLQLAHQSTERPAGAMTRADAANYLGVSIRMVDYYAERGELPRVKQGSKTTFLVSELDSLLQRLSQSA